jgi:hypothetical protein
MMTVHNNNTPSDQNNINLTDMEDPELCIEQQSLLYPSASVDYDDNKSKNKPAKMLSSYRGRRRLVVLAVAVAVTLGIVVVWGPLSSKVEEEGTSYQSIHPSFIRSFVHGGTESKKSFPVPISFIRDCKKGRTDETVSFSRKRSFTMTPPCMSHVAKCKRSTTFITLSLRWCAPLSCTFSWISIQIQLSIVASFLA